VGETIDRLVTADEVADRLVMSTAWVLREARAGRIPHHRFGRAVRFRMVEIDAWLAERSPHSRRAA
jgi:excisionase family DNA binding protein